MTRLPDDAAPWLPHALPGVYTEQWDAAASADTDDRARAQRGSYLGLTLTSHRPQPCPRTLVGRRHGRDSCWCVTRLNDHGRRWRYRDGRSVVMWEPYAVDGHALAAVLAAAEQDGLDVEVSGASPYYPGRTFALIFTAAESKADQ